MPFLYGLFTLQNLFLAIIFVISITLHEFAHAWMADRLGDPTPRDHGRVTLDPRAHIDIRGFVLIFLIGFGWGRPVLYNPSYLKNPRTDEPKIAFAGPVMNLILALIAIIILIIYQAIVGPHQGLVTLFFTQFAFLNIALAVFNMIPLPPLDGYRLIHLFAPEFSRRIAQYGQWILIGFVVLFIFGPGAGLLGSYIMGVTQFIFNGLYMLVAYPLSLLF